jgi:hypothetical protein
MCAKGFECFFGTKNPTNDLKNADNKNQNHVLSWGESTLQNYNKYGECESDQVVFYLFVHFAIFGIILKTMTMHNVTHHTRIMIHVSCLLCNSKFWMIQQ